MSLEAKVAELERKLAAAHRKLEEMGAKFDEVGQKWEKGTERVQQLNGAIDGFLSVGAKASSNLVTMSDAFTRFGKTSEVTAGAVGKIIGAAGKVAGIVPFVGPALTTMTDSVAKVTGAAGKLTNMLTKASKEFINLFDAPSRGIRAFDQDMFNLNKRFTGTLSEAQKFADSLKLAGGTGFAKSLHLTTNEMANFVRHTKGTSLTQEQLTRTVNTGVGAVNLYAAATAFAASASMDAGSAARLMNTLMNEQGQTAQEATNTLGLYVGVAEETGLAIDKVAVSLNNAVNNFAKIGMTADFGTPILKGFAKTMTDMGLGIENSVSLSTELTSALGGLADKYEMAYLTFQRGGLEMGGSGSGGALSAGIALQAAYLDANKTGDQADISNKLFGV